MARYALITFAGGGNLPPLMNLAAHLQARGHEVHVLADAGVEAAARAVPAPFTHLPELDFWAPTVPRSVPQAIGQAVGLLSDRSVEQRVRAELGRLQPDVVLVDCLVAGCVRAARADGFRTVVLFHTYLDYWTKNLARGPVGMIAALRGRGPRRSWDAADLRIVMCDADLDPSPRPAGTIWTGNTEGGRPAASAEPPLVVVSLSTMEVPGQPDAYRRIVRALGTLPVRAVVTLGGLTVDGLEAQPNVEIRGRVPHEELFPHASLVIGHGGLSTTFRALAHGLPLLVMPMHPMLDQPLVARSVVDAGAGMSLKRSASSEAVAEAVRRILDDPTYATTARRIGERLRATDGLSAATTAVEGLIADGLSERPASARTAPERQSPVANEALRATSRHD